MHWIVFDCLNCCLCVCRGVFIVKSKSKSVACVIIAGKFHIPTFTIGWLLFTIEIQI